MHCSPRGCLKQHFSLLPPPDLQCLGHGLDLCCELIYKAPLLPPLPPYHLILDVPASLPDPRALVLHPLHGAGVFPIMLSFVFQFKFLWIFGLGSLTHTRQLPRGDRFWMGVVACWIGANPARCSLSQQGTCHQLVCMCPLSPPITLCGRFPKEEGGGENVIREVAVEAEGKVPRWSFAEHI